MNERVDRMEKCKAAPPKKHDPSDVTDDSPQCNQTRLNCFSDKEIAVAGAVNDLAANDYTVGFTVPHPGWFGFGLEWQDGSEGGRVHPEAFHLGEPRPRLPCVVVRRADHRSCSGQGEPKELTAAVAVVKPALLEGGCARSGTHSDWSLALK